MLLPRRLQCLRGQGIPLQQVLEHLFAIWQRGGLALLGILETDDAALGAGDGPADQDDAQLVVDHHDLEVLDGDVLVTHAAGHLLAGHDTASAALRGTGGTNGPVVLGVSVRRLLAGEAVALHASGEAHAAGPRLDVDVLALLEPVGHDLHAHGQQAALVADHELGELALGGDALGLVVSQHRAGHVARGPRPGPDLHRPVAVLLPRLVGHDLHLVELQHCARHPRLADVDARHALLGGEHPRAQRCRLLAPLERRRWAGRELRETRGWLVESLVLGSGRCRRPAVFDAALGDHREEQPLRGLAGAGPWQSHP